MLGNNAICFPIILSQYFEYLIYYIVKERGVVSVNIKQNLSASKFRQIYNAYTLYS